MAGRIVGGLLVRLNGHLFSTSVRHEMMYAPACWRCGGPLYLDTARLVPSDEDAHPYVWSCVHCMTDLDRATIETPGGRGVK